MIVLNNNIKSLKLYLSVLFVGFIGSELIAQESKEIIGTESVTVVKSFSAELEAVDKVVLKPKPLEIAKTKLALQYRVKGFPVAEAFAPKFTAPPLFLQQSDFDGLPGYASLNLGNFNATQLRLGISDHPNENSIYSIAGSFNSYKTSPDEVLLDPFYRRGGLMGSYTFLSKNTQWKSGITYQKDAFNYYGQFLSGEEALDLLSESKESNQNYSKLDAFSKVSFSTGIVKGVGVRYKSISDLTNSEEQFTAATANISLPVSSKHLDLQIGINLLDGGFKNASLLLMANEVALPYSYAQVEIYPRYQVQNKDWDLSFGLKAKNTSGESMSESKLNIFPTIYATYQLSNDVLIKSGLDGDYQLNTFSQFASENPFVSPTLDILPSYNKYRIYAGLEASSGSVFSLYLRGEVSQVENQPLFALNPINYFRSEDAGYLNNGVASFRVLYDLVNRYTAQAGVHVYPNKKTDFSAGISYNTYETTREEFAWNLPKIVGFANLNLQFLEDWSFRGQINYIGTRNDLQVDVVQFIQAGEYPRRIIELPAYLKIDAEFGYRYTENWSFNLGVNNVGTPYTGWVNFPEFGTQVLLGAQYHFNL